MNVEKGPVVIGMDPHKRSVTIEVMTADESVLGGGRFATDVEGFAAMLAEARSWPERTWAVEGCNGIGRHVANRLIAAGEHVVDVPPKPSARARVFATGQGRKTDATDAHSDRLGPDLFTQVSGPAFMPAPTLRSAAAQLTQRPAVCRVTR